MLVYFLSLPNVSPCKLQEHQNCSTTRPGLPAILHGVQGVKRKEGGKQKGSSRHSVSAKKNTLNILKQWGVFFRGKGVWERSFIRRFSLFVGNFGI